MIPIRNKKTLQVTVEEMRKFAFSYVEKYAPSKQQLKTYLLKKYLKLSLKNINKKEITNLIDIVLEDLEKNKFINDKFYSDSKARSMIQRGNSINKIRNYLIAKGINNELIRETVNDIENKNNYTEYNEPHKPLSDHFCYSTLINSFPRHKGISCKRDKN